MANIRGPSPPLNNASLRCSTLRTADATARGLRVLVIIETEQFVGRHVHHPSTGCPQHPLVSVVCMPDSVLPTGSVLRVPRMGCGIKI